MLNSKLKALLLLIAVFFITVSKATTVPHTSILKIDFNKLDKLQHTEPLFISTPQKGTTPIFEFDLENDEEDDDGKNHIHFLVTKPFKIVYSENNFRVAHPTSITLSRTAIGKKLPVNSFQ